MYGYVSIFKINLFNKKKKFFFVLDSNISEHSHLFNEVNDDLSKKFHSIIIRLQNFDQYSSIHNILKTTKNELNKV